MAEKRTCDCCGTAMEEYDAGTVPVVLRAKGIDLVVTVVPRDGERPNVRPACLKTLMADAELVYPAKKPITKAPKVVDPDAAESDEEREAHHPVPLRAASNG